ncbi:E3 ubiquitin-protein ligase TRIM9 isoform X1 [Hydra vulgaris]|uniref:E3 ubiquitin-protein ligase TRIM9 isoform X1 n=1 Tax=Hydra vulgaris TaxID=6087 RepID=UPI00064127FE|nr:E3 ubiquitin-protein ligase TRIM9 [Hydra vulgaris]
MMDVPDGLYNELKCVKCLCLLTNPLSLPCSHNICYKCAKESLVTESQVQSHFEPYQVDKSGYKNKEKKASLNQISSSTPALVCSKCCIYFILDERGVDGLTKNLILERLVEKQKVLCCELDCQLCETTPSAKASFTCEQCLVSYCYKCLAIYHPKRGPLASHSLVEPQFQRIKHIKKENLTCSEHVDENISMYCALCKTPVCYLCFDEGRHKGHESKALGIMFKDQKNDMVSLVSALEVKSNELIAFAGFLEMEVGTLHENGVELESLVVAKIDELVLQLEKKKLDLIEHISSVVAAQNQQLILQKDNITKTTTSLSALIHYTKEVLKETDPSTFLSISSSLCSRVASTLKTMIKVETLDPAVLSEIDLSLSIQSIEDVITNTHFQKAQPKKKIKKPSPPVMLLEKCTVKYNTIALEWRDPPGNLNQVDLYIVELDDGLNGSFQDVLKTKETSCILKGLQCSSTYRVKVRCVNSAGESQPGQTIIMNTSKLAVFQFDKENSHSDIVHSNKNRTITCTSFENRVALCDIGFCRGKHYWEVHIDRYEGNPDPAIGVAQQGCIKDAILGKDNKAWSIYVDSTRSWFQHNNAHMFRSEGGIATASTIGLFLDMENSRLTFYRNKIKHGPVEFPDMKKAGIVYPAFSLNRNVTLTLFTGQELPAEIG